MHTEIAPSTSPSRDSELVNGLSSVSQRSAFVGHHIPTYMRVLAQTWIGHAVKSNERLRARRGSEPHIHMFQGVSLWNRASGMHSEMLAMCAHGLQEHARIRSEDAFVDKKALLRLRGEFMDVLRDGVV